MGPVQLPRETEDNDNAKLWSDKQRALWYVMVFLEWSIGPEAGNDFHGRLARASTPSPLTRLPRVPRSFFQAPATQATSLHRNVSVFKLISY